MTNPDTTPERLPRNAESWARPVKTLTVQDMPAEAINLNVHGRRQTGPLHGFGQLWQKTYRIRLADVTAVPAEIISQWKANFPAFWPEGSRFYGPLAGSVKPGEVAVLNLSMPGGGKVSTGIRVIYADEESFSFMTPQGHMFAGMITFSAFEEEDSSVAQVQVLIRASDPVYEMGFRLGFAHKMEDQFWQATLQNLAAHFGSSNSAVQQTTVCVDKKLQWSEARNIWYNAAIRTAVYMPVHLVKGLFGRR